MFTARDRQKCQELFDTHYAGQKFSRAKYRDLIHQNVQPGMRLLDAGCGHYLEFSRELAESVQVVGVDLEEHLDTHNRRSPFALRGNLETLPFRANSFDVVISRSVVEHLTDPGAVFREFHRVLKPGGVVILSTPNKWDYISVAARLTPYKFHRSVVSKMLGVKEDDVFPTFYRANTLSRLGRTLNAAGFAEKRLMAVSHYPAYLMFSPLVFRLGMLYEKLVSTEAFRFFRGTLLCVFQKPKMAMVAHEEQVAREVGV